MTDVRINWPYDRSTVLCTADSILHGNEAVESVTLHVFSSSGKSDEWTEAFQTVRSLPSLKRLQVCSATGYPNLWLPVSTQTETLRACATTLEGLTLHGVGFATREHEQDFAALQRTCQDMQRLRSCSVTDLYFHTKQPQQNQQDQQQQVSWMQCSRFCQALASLPVVVRMQMSAIQVRYSRPALTLSALHALLSCPKQLQTLSLQHFTVWGGGSALACAAALRGNATLRTLCFRHAVFAGEDSVLAGIAGNSALHGLSLRHCMLHLTESAALARGLRKNATLQSLSLRGARLGVDCPTHLCNLQECIHSLRQHPALTALDVRCGGNTVDAVRNAVERVLAQNRVLTEVRLSEPSAAVEHALGLNRAKFWELSQECSDATDWMRALSVATDNHSCLYHMLRENPLLFQQQQ